MHRLLSSALSLRWASLWLVGSIAFLAACIVFLPSLLDDIRFLPVLVRDLLTSSSADADDAALLHAPLGPTLQHGPYASYFLGRHYPGWIGIDRLFVFGDSYSSTSFDLDGPQPSREHPLGNPDDDLATSTNGQNWVKYLTTLHNATLLQTVVFAWGGATVDSDLISNHLPISSLRSFKDQVEDFFLPSYGSRPSSFDWHPGSTLFAVWFGLNDIKLATDDNAHLFAPIWQEYGSLVERMYQTGARNFLLLNIPPIDHTPIAAFEHLEAPWKRWVAEWNQNLTLMAQNLTRSHPDATTIIFDTFNVFGDAIEDPTRFPEVASFKDVSTDCGAYTYGGPPGYKHEMCDYPIDDYMWLNDFHPTTKTHNLTARTIRDALVAI